MERAVDSPQDVLRPPGFEPVVETRDFDDMTFRRDPSASNRIWVNGQPTDDWNGVLFGFYYLHMPWRIPVSVREGSMIAGVSKRYRSAWIGVAVRSAQTVGVGLILLAVVV